MLKYFKSSIASTIIGLIMVYFIGLYYTQTQAGAWQTVFIATILSILEVSLSFDNAIVNAMVLKEMTPVWRQRFLTWGMLIAVFGMRLVLPLLIVTVIGQINPIEALNIAIFHPDQYAKTMLEAHLAVMAFGGAFLLMVCLKYFFDENKDQHWIAQFERPLTIAGKMEAIEIGMALMLVLTVSHYLPQQDQMTYLFASVAGIVLYILVDGLGSLLEASEETKKDIEKASIGMFIYLEVLDASFSFDGVVGAFAITNNLFVIMIGLSIGAFFVRSLTIMFVEKNTLSHFAFLEHGAFYAIGSLAFLMLLDPFLHIPEWVTGTIGGLIIAASFISSIKLNKKQKA